MQRKFSASCGSALVDYVIPTAVVGLVIGLALYNIVSGGSLVKFVESSIKGQVTDGVLIIK